MSRRAGAVPFALLLVALVVAGCSSAVSTGGAESTRVVTVEGPTDTPAGGDGEDGVADGVEPVGFTTATARITDVDGVVCEFCVWLADTAEERERGLMGVTSLGEAAGMVFRFEELDSGSFFMFQTPTPLSIAWFTAAGQYIDETDMEPCFVEASDCVRYSPGVEYQFALEVFEGGLKTLGVGPGARLELVGESTRCEPTPPTS